MAKELNKIIQGNYGYGWEDVSYYPLGYRQIKGNDAIILNKLVPEYEKANAQLKDLKQTVEALKEQIISLSVAGVNKTNKVAWKRTDVEGYEKAIKLSTIKEKDLKFYNKLVEKGFTEFTKGSVRLTDITIL